MRSFIISSLTFVVFLVLDLVDYILCAFYAILDRIFEGNPSPCYCVNRGGDKFEELGLSETLRQRRNVFRRSGILGIFSRKFENSAEDSGERKSVARWSDCGCESCASWMRSDGDLKLHVRISDHSSQSQGHGENVVFLHGFLSSSSFWTETVFPKLSEPLKQSHRLFAVDLLGFGKSPKPRKCLYTLKEHVEMIDKSVISQFQLLSFHLVAHSMGCVIAIALAAKYPNAVKSITLVAPPFFGSKEAGSSRVMEKLVGKTLWPAIRFGSAVMSWYEHVGRTVCFLVCRNHATIEKILKLFTRTRNLHFMIMDLTRHTHESAWHTMHNVICGGAELMESYLKLLAEARVQMFVVQGDCDKVVPIECTQNFKTMVPNARVDFVTGANHSSVVLGRSTQFTAYLEHIWTSCN